jgi:hypothetical protein
LLYLGAWFKYQEYLPNKGKVLLLNHRMEKKKREKKVLPCIAKKKKKKKKRGLEELPGTSNSSTTK